MVYKRKKIFKRFRKRYKKKFKKKFKRKYKKSKYSTAFKRKHKVKLFYTIPVLPTTIPGGTGGALSTYNYIRLNSLNPSGSSGVQPQYYDQLKSVYGRFRVTGAKVRLKFELKSNALADTAPIAGIVACRGLIFNFGVPPDGSNILPNGGIATTTDQARRLGQHPDIYHKELQYSPTESKSFVFKKYFDFKKIIGNKFITEGENYEADDNADPLRALYLCWSVTKADSDPSIPYTFTYTGSVRYYVVCTRRDFVVDA